MFALIWNQGRILRETDSVISCETVKEDQTIELHFLHPRDAGTTLIADVNPLVTGEEALVALQSAVEGEAPFIPPLRQGRFHDLELRRTGKHIPRSLTFEEAGVVSGDEILICESMAGGGMDASWSDLGQMVFWSVAAASVFLKYASPILVEFLRGRSSRSIKIRDGDYEIEITGDNPEKALDILKMLKKRRDVLDGSHVGSKDRLTSPITVTLRDSKSPDSLEDDSG